MRFLTCAAALSALVLTGCGSGPEMRPDPVEIKGTVKLPGGAPPTGLTVTFQPQQNSLPGGAKLAADGSFTVQLTPGKYSVYFQDEANAKVPAYKSIPEKYRSPGEATVVTVESGKPLAIDVN